MEVVGEGSREGGGFQAERMAPANRQVGEELGRQDAEGSEWLA